MNGRFVFLRILSAVLLIGVLTAAGVLVYNAGVAHGLAAQVSSSGQAGQVPGTAVAPYPYFAYGPFLHPWGLLFFPFALLAPLFFFFVVMALLRGIFFRRWGGPRHHGWHGMHEGPSPFDEWHRRAHEQAATPSGEPPHE